MRSVTVVGASLAGLSAVTALRAQSYDGRIVVVGDEHHPPYDRPPLSKGFLAGTTSAEELALHDPSDTDGLDVTWRLGVRARALDPADASVVLESGERVPGDGVVVATGARARALPHRDPSQHLRGVHALRTLDDAVALRDELRPGARLVVIGGGFIGAEVASTARGLGLDVTVLEAAPVPLGAALGPRMAAACAGLHAEHGTRLRCDAAVAGFVGTDRVRGVRLADGHEVPADVVVVGVGATPNTEWLAGAGITGPAGVLTTELGATAVPGVVAAGDCAAVRHPGTGALARHEHWAHAQHQPRAAVATLLGRTFRRPRSARVPYFWSDQYSRRIQYAGHHEPADDVDVVEGDPDAHDVVAVYRRAGRAVAVVAIGRASAFTSWRRRLAAAAEQADPADPADPADAA